MPHEVTIDARWDGDAKVWLATSADVPGLVVEAETWTLMMAEVPIVVAELLDVQGTTARPIGFTFRAEERLELAS